MPADDLCPHPYDPLMAIAWAGFIQWAMFGDDEYATALRKMFEQESGQRFVAPGRSPLEQAIDKACGIDDLNTRYVHDYIVWLNETQWGDVNAMTEEDE